MHIVSGAHRRRHLHLPAAVIEALFKHPLTDIGLERFLKDWEKAQAVKADAWTASSTSRSSAAR